ncbi:hypothetical protein ACPF04_06080 [Campylobacter sp. MOP51]|uniref:hypothetical protein n=1 Tax=Campylobacter canis TaxID=3378588 RepID=UPI003C63E6AA
MGFIPKEELSYIRLREVKSKKIHIKPDIISGADIEVVGLKTRVALKIKGYEQLIHINHDNLLYIIQQSGMSRGAHLIGDYVLVCNKVYQVYCIPTNDTDYHSIVNKEDEDVLVLNKGNIYNLFFKKQNIRSFNGKYLEETSDEMLELQKNGVLPNAVFCGTAHVCVELEDDPQLGKNILWYEQKEPSVYIFYLLDHDMYVYMAYRQKIELHSIPEETKIPYNKLWNVLNYDKAVNIRIREAFMRGEISEGFLYTTKFNVEENKAMAQEFGEEMTNYIVMPQ